MKIQYVYKNGEYSYNCHTCGGLCCNLNGKLYFTKKQVQSELEILRLYDYLVKEGDGFALNTPKACWFLKDKECKIEIGKPLECKLYPITFNKIRDDIIIAYIIPCPSFHNQGTKRIHHDYDDLILEYASHFNVGFDPLIKKLNNFYDHDLDFHLASADKYKVFTNDPMLSIFTQILFIAPMLILPSHYYPTVEKYWIALYFKYKDSFSNTLNLYLFLKVKVLKYVFRYYYSPSLNGKSIPYDNQDNELFESYYRDNHITWKFDLKENDRGKV